MSVALGAQAGRLSSRLLHNIKHTDSHFSHIPIHGFHGAWLHFQRAIVGIRVYHSWCEIQASKHYVESLPLVLKNKRSCFSQGERLGGQLPLDRVLALRK